MASIGISNFSVGQTDYIANLNTWITFSETWASETETARGGFASLNARLNNMDSDTDYVTASSTQTVASLNMVVFADTSGGAFTLTLPASPSANEYVRIKHASTTSWQANNLTIAGNGKSFLGPDGSTDTTLVLDTDLGGVELVYNGTYWSFY